jgi:beta-glucosidase-like glycosyl hydrolase/CubicO group peptidase (beta-lactamase class C family)
MSAQKQAPEFLELESKWVDSVQASLTPDQRIAQLFMVAAWSNRDMKHVRQIDSLVSKYNIGGLIFMQGGPYRQAKLVNYYQTRAQTPILMAIDGEFGLAMRLDSMPQYPRQMTLAAMNDDSMIYWMGRQIARECKSVGIHVNFAPVVDINNNPENPVISMRSFGEDKLSVAKKSYLYMKGLQDEHVLACAKHFPGHGDTDKDSHKTLPTIAHSADRIDSLELFPFKYLIERGLGSMMVAHLFIPSLDTSKNLPSTLSKNIVTGLLKEKLQFKGLVFTDALNMKGAADYNKPGMLDAKALVAGNDVLLFSEDVPKAMEEIKKAMERGEITQEEIDARCKKILRVKFWCGLDKKPFSPTRILDNEMKSEASVLMRTKLAESSMTLLQNRNNILPLQSPDTLKIAEVSVGSTEKNMFSQNFVQYFKTDFYGVSHDERQDAYDTLLRKLAAYNLLIVQVNRTNQKPESNFGASVQSFAFIDKLVQLKPSIVVLFSNPYIFNKFANLQNAAAVLEGYEYNTYAQKAASDAVAGAIGVNGHLPISTTSFKAGTGITIPKAIRIQQVAPIVMGIEKKKLEQIDSIAVKGIEDKCYPGCVILAAKDGKVFYHKAFGKYTYEGTDSVTTQTIYDLASVTKVASSALALMDLVGQKKLDINQTLGHYLPEVRKSNKSEIVIKEMLVHQAGLPAGVLNFQPTLNKDNSYKPGYYSKEQSNMFANQVADSLFALTTYCDSIFKRILNCKLGEKKYLYSDLGYYFTKRITEKITKTDLNNYVEQNFYSKMGLRNLHYFPQRYFPRTQIAPTENDTKWRKQIVWGYVHDQGAALCGGVGGHAGLFGNAFDMAALMQMYLDKGHYAGRQWLDSSVVKKFTRECLFCPDNRRGLCFDKPETNPKKDSPVPEECMPEGFGHSGFTGTLVWADPGNGLVYVFLSNRVYPNADENKLAKSGIRGQIHRLLYQAVAEARNPKEILKRGN